ncbi:hypothetical protein ACQ86N_13515 [Puia sp. P3]|uniref:hypothetical protein n=1 Tax=Puia sp. P3 TaxID=3423952 RepID=UPI003D66D2B8
MRPVTVSGIFKTGIEDYDRLIAIGDLRLIQRLSGWEANEIGGYELFTSDYRKASLIDSLIFARLPHLGKPYHRRNLSQYFSVAGPAGQHHRPGTDHHDRRGYAEPDHLPGHPRAGTHPYDRRPKGPG